jgi:hypothetical protein
LTAFELGLGVSPPKEIAENIKLIIKNFITMFTYAFYCKQVRIHFFIKLLPQSICIFLKTVTGTFLLQLFNLYK